MRRRSAQHRRKVDLPQPERLPGRAKIRAAARSRSGIRSRERSVPDAPKVGPASAKVDLPQPDRSKPREFVPPARLEARGRRARGALPDAPTVAGSSGPESPGAFGARAAAAPSRVQPAAGSRSNRPRPRQRLPEAPQIEHGVRDGTSATGGSLTAAIVGLKPADRLTELPEGSRPARSSPPAANRMEDGGKGEPVESAKLFVPDLMIRDGAITEPDATLVKRNNEGRAAPTSTENLSQAARSRCRFCAPKRACREFRRSRARPIRASADASSTWSPSRCRT